MALESGELGANPAPSTSSGNGGRKASSPQGQCEDCLGERVDSKPQNTIEKGLGDGGSSQLTDGVMRSFSVAAGGFLDFRWASSPAIMLPSALL